MKQRALTFLSNFLMASKLEEPALSVDDAALNTRFSNSIFVLLIGLYFAVTALTRAVFQGDTPFYVASISDYSGKPDFEFWDFGHLLWRSANWGLFQIIHRFVRSVDSTSLAFWILLSVNWLAGLGCVLLVARIARKFVSSHLAFLAALTLLISQVFLNFLHTGSAYVPALYFLLLGLQFASSKPSSATASWYKSAAVGAALAMAVLLWLPFVFALPAVFLFPIIIYGFDRESCLHTLRAILVCVVLGLGTYSLVAMKLGLSSAVEIQTWFNAASHSIDHIGGVSRAAFGFVRSWFEMGNVGRAFRRFLLHDPYAPVSAVSLILAGTWKLILTYIFLGAIALKLLFTSSQDRRMLFFLALAFLPVFAFGVKWQGGDMERYIAAFPALLLAGACAMNSHPSRAFKLLGVTFVSALTIVNLSNDLRWVQDAQDRRLSAQLDALGSIPDNSYIVFFPSDPLASFISSGSILSRGRMQPLTARWVLTVGSSHAREWRQDFASRSLKAWQNGQEVWICRGLLDEVPESRWGWVEGAEPSVPWRDIHTFFIRVRTSEIRGEFVQIPPTNANRELLQGVLSKAQ
jgi:hypothetical protein